MNNKRSKTYFQRQKNKNVKYHKLFNNICLLSIQPRYNLDNSKNMNEYQKRIEYRCFGKDISNEIYNINKNLNSILDKINKARNENLKYSKSVNSINNKKNKGKENSSIIINKSKNNENISNNINCIKNYNDKKKENIFSINNKSNILNIDKSTNRKIIYRKNPIEEYDEVIMKNMFSIENTNRANYKILKQIFKGNDFTSRFFSINLIISISENFDLKQETIYLAINIFDRCFLKYKAKYNFFNIKLFIISCIFVAAKYEEIYPPLIEDYYEFFNFSNSDLFKLENFILDIINFDLHICSPYLFLTKFFYSFAKKEYNQILYLAQLVLDILTLDLEFCAFKPSYQAVICLYISKLFTYKDINGIKLWTDDNEFITGYSEKEIKSNMKLCITIIKKFNNGSFFKDINKTAIIKKYSDYKYLRVAKIFKDFY